MFEYNKNLTSVSQNLRKNMTKEERHLWYDFLKFLPITVKRQFVIENYIVDFYIPAKKTVIELDGSQHFVELKQQDVLRDNNLSKHGIMVLRYANNDVNKNFKGVCEDIARNLGIDFNDITVK